MADAEGRIFWFNRKWYEYTGTTPDQMKAGGWYGVHDPAVLPMVIQRWKAAIASGEPDEMVFPLRAHDGTFRPFLTRVQPLKDDSGHVGRWFGTNTDISEQNRITEALEEERSRLETLNEVMARVSSELNLERLVQAVTDAGVAITGARFGAFFYNIIDAGGDALTLYTISGVAREHFSKFPNPRATKVFAPTFKGEAPLRSDDILCDPRYGHNAPHRGMPEGHLPVRSYLALPVKSRSGEVMGGLFFGHPEPARFTARHEELLIGIAGQAAIGIDNARLYDAAQREIAERREAESHRELLINELNHRVKNTLTTVQSVAAQTLRNSGVDDDVQERLGARLIALSEAHNLLTEHHWESTTLRQVADMALRPYRTTAADKFSVDGPKVELSPKTALAVAMALHELATNALKYGALTNVKGRVSLRWKTISNEAEERLEITWREDGGPPVTPPTRKGFGSRLIQRGLAAELGGSVELAFPASGVICRVDAPIPRLLAREV
jgi:PAS domain S-box-containing protein